MIRLLLISLVLFSFKGFSQAVSGEFLLGRTKGDLPYLEYGLGEDRLGGAKMGYLDTMVVIKVVDSARQDYKIQLSKNRTAYIPKEYFRKDSSLRSQPFYLATSSVIFGDAEF